jgi:acetyl esterase
VPLDPFFAERLRVHRRYLVGRVFGTARARIASLWPFGSTPAPTASRSSKPRLSPRARHRRAALAWDRSELETVGTPGPDVSITEHEIAGTPPFRVRVYRPHDADGAIPAVLSFFGGAFRIGGIDYPTTDAAHRRRALDAGIAVVAVDYALAPEHRYPAQVEQAYAALEWLVGQAPELGIDVDRIGVAGVSAGANIAAALTLVNRERGAYALRLQLLEVPVTDLTGGSLDLRATRAMGIPSLLAMRELRSVARTYLGDLRRAKEPFASPLRAPSLEGLPPAVVLTAEYDPLRGDGDAYGAALRRAGVDASVVRYQGVTHDTPIFTGALPAARRWHDDVVCALRRLSA